MKFISAIAAAAVAMSGAAFAAPCTVGTCTVTDSSGGALDPLDFSNSIAIQDENVDIAIGGSMPYSGAGSFEIAPGILSADGIADISFSEIIPPATVVAAGFADLTIEFFQGATSLGTFVFTDADGVAISDTFTLAFVSNSVVDFVINGTVFRNFGAALPDYNINIAASEIPVPAALPLLLAGIAGLGFASRRGRKSAA